MPETNESTLQAGLPNPLRLPLLFVVGVLAALGGYWWWGGNGGLDVSRYPPADPESVAMSFSLYFYVRDVLALPLTVLLGIGLLVAWMRTGTVSAVAGLRFLIGSQRSDRLPGAARFLAVWARVATWGGLLVGFAACGAIEIAIPLFHMPADSVGIDPFDLWDNILWESRIWARAGPLVGVFLGRFVLGTLAEGARIRTDETCASAFSPLQDLVLVGLFLIPVYQTLLTWRLW